MNATSRPKGLFILPADNFELIYGPEERETLGTFLDLPSFPIDPMALPQHGKMLAEAEVIFSGWGAPRLDEAFLAMVPKLRAFFYAAGSIKEIVTEAFWRRDIPIFSAYGANAVPVSEFILAEIILSLKRVWYFLREVRERRSCVGFSREVPGAFRSVVGLVSLGAIGRLVAEKLRILDVHVLAYDPYVSPQEAAMLGVEMCSLAELFQRSDVVSLHSPWLPATEGMITGRLLESMKPRATLINAARGAIIREEEMIEVLRRRFDLQAVLDVTWPEPPPPDSPLYSLPNVVLTPHIAGSMNKECRRLGQWMVEEARRFFSSEPLRWRITQERASLMA